MDVDVGGNPKKRSAEVSLEELPFAKRTKYKELFPSAFSTIEDVNMNTLKIQNRELLVKLTERTKSVESLQIDLATAEANRAAVARNVATFAIFMTQIVDEMESLTNILPVNGHDAKEGAKSSDWRCDLLQVFESCVVQAENFSGESSVELVALRNKMLEMARTVANIVRREMSSLPASAGFLSATSTTKNAEEATMKREMNEAKRKALEYEAQAMECEKATALWRERAEDVTERLKRMVGHVTRVEMAMEQMEARFEEEKRTLSAPSPMIASSSTLIQRMMMRNSTGISPTASAAVTAAPSATTGNEVSPIQIPPSTSPSLDTSNPASTSNTQQDSSITSEVMSQSNAANANEPLLSPSPAPGAEGSNGELSMSSSACPIAMPTWEDLQMLESMKEEALQELESTKVLLQSRLDEIKVLTEEKIALSKKCGGMEVELEILKKSDEISSQKGNGSSDLSSSSSAAGKSIVDDHRLDEAKVWKQAANEAKEALAQHQAESKKLQEAFESSKKQLDAAVKAEVSDYRSKLERMSAKLKGMEAERDRVLHLHASAESAAKDSLAHVSHYQSLLKRHEEVQAALEKMKEENGTLQRQLEVSANPTLLKDMEHALESAKREVALLKEGWRSFAEAESDDSLFAALQALQAQSRLDKSEVASSHASSSSNGMDVDASAATGSAKGDDVPSKSFESSPKSEKIAFLMSCISRISDLSGKVLEAKEKEESARMMSESFESALDELGAENMKLSKELGERESRLAILLKERVNSASAATSSKRLGHIESALHASQKSLDSSLERLLEEERKLSSERLKECERKTEEANALRSQHTHLEGFKLQAAAAMDILKAKLLVWQEKVKKCQQLVEEAKEEAETAKASNARLQEELTSTKRSLQQIQQQQSQAASTSASGGAADSSEMVKLQKQIAMYRGLFNCSLCSRTRQVNCALSCGHTFCRHCIDTKCMAGRNRKCPKCKVSISQSEILPIFF